MVQLLMAQIRAQVTIKEAQLLRVQTHPIKIKIA